MLLVAPKDSESLKSQTIRCFLMTVPALISTERQIFCARILRAPLRSCGDHGSRVFLGSPACLLDQSGVKSVVIRCSNFQKIRFRVLRVDKHVPGLRHEHTRDSQ